MQDICHYSTDGKSIFLELILVSTRAGKIIIVILNCLAWILFTSIFYFLPTEEVGSFLIPFFLIVAFLVYFPGRFAAWNLWGREFIRFNPKSITYSRSYGLFNTREKTIQIRQFAYSYEANLRYGDKMFGRLKIFDYNESDHPLQIFETAVTISSEDMNEIIQLLQSVRASSATECAIRDLNLN